MQHYQSLDNLHLQGSWATIGSFDGVHLGHQKIIQDLTTGAHHDGAPAVVLTFFPHPSVVLGKRNDPFYLTTPERRAELLGDLGVDIVVTLPFTLELSRLTALEFMQMLTRSLGVKKLQVGYDFALGKGREGNVDRLKEIGLELGYQVEVNNPIKINGDVVSSSLIRQALRRGDVARAMEMLGRPHRISGKIIPGDGRGRTIGIPTANIDLSYFLALPETGVYVCRTRVDGRWYGSVTNVGQRPTFETSPVPTRVETHILDTSGDLYGKVVDVDFISRVRGEQRFPSVQALVDQIHADIEVARGILDGQPVDADK